MDRHNFRNLFNLTGGGYDLGVGRVRASAAAGVLEEMFNFTKYSEYVSSPLIARAIRAARNNKDGLIMLGNVSVDIRSCKFREDSAWIMNVKADGISKEQSWAKVDITFPDAWERFGLVSFYHLSTTRIKHLFRYYRAILSAHAYDPAVDFGDQVYKAVSASLSGPLAGLHSAVSSFHNKWFPPGATVRCRRRTIGLDDEVDVPADDVTPGYYKSDDVEIMPLGCDPDEYRVVLALVTDVEQRREHFRSLFEVLRDHVINEHLIVMDTTEQKSLSAPTLPTVAWASALAVAQPVEGRLKQHGFSVRLCSGYQKENEYPKTVIEPWSGSDRAIAVSLRNDDEPQRGELRAAFMRASVEALAANYLQLLQVKEAIDAIESQKMDWGWKWDTSMAVTTPVLRVTHFNKNKYLTWKPMELMDALHIRKVHSQTSVGRLAKALKLLLRTWGRVDSRSKIEMSLESLKKCYNEGTQSYKTFVTRNYAEANGEQLLLCAKEIKARDTRIAIWLVGMLPQPGLDYEGIPENEYGPGAVYRAQHALKAGRQALKRQ